MMEAATAPARSDLIVSNRLRRATFVTILLFFYAFPVLSLVSMVKKPNDQKQACQAKNEQQQL
jgi:preprotein translocase subunit SecG